MNSNIAYLNEINKLKNRSQFKVNEINKQIKNNNDRNH